MGNESLRGKMSEAWTRFRHKPQEVEKAEDAPALATREEIQSLFALIEETISKKVRTVSIYSNGHALGIINTPQGRLAFIERPSEDDPSTRIGLKTDGERIIERYEVGIHSEAPQLSETVTEEEIK